VVFGGRMRGRRPGVAWGALKRSAAKLCLPGCVWLLAAASVFCALEARTAIAQQRVGDKLLDTVVGNSNTANPPIDHSKPLLLQADHLIYDNQGTKVTAQGNVELYYNNYAVLADKVVYDQAANTLMASGNVRIKEPNGSLISADQVTLSDDLRDGFISSLRVVTKDDVRIAASSATRKEGNTTVFENGVFTPCKPCQDNPDAPPIWRIRAQTITHVESESNVYFQNAFFDLYGVPLAYIPYFYAPDPSVKRRTGFLAPSIGNSTTLGYYAEVPYFWALAPNADLTLSPEFTSKFGVLGKAEWRHRLENGTYKIDLAGIDQTQIPEGSTTSSKFRGSIVTQGDFSLGSWWTAGWSGTFQSDDTFRRFYGLDNILTTDEVSDLHLIGQSDRDYFGAYLYHFGGLLAQDNQTAESNALPSADYHYVVPVSVAGGELTFDGNALSLTRSFNPVPVTAPMARSDTRFIAQTKWRTQLIDPAGEVFTPFLSGRADLYQISGLENPVTGTNPTDESVFRATGTAGLQYEYPFVAHASWGSQVLEPIGQILVRPNTVTQGVVPNEDAQSLVFDDTLLFDTDKFSGYDKIETGTRANYGMQYTAQANNGGYLRAVAGESVQLAGTNPFDPASGLGTTQSDYVLGLYAAPTSQLQFVSQSLFDSSTFELVREGLGASFTVGPTTIATNYSLDLTGSNLSVRGQTQEILSTATVQWTPNWSTTASGRYDITDHFFVTDSLGVKWSNECIGLSVTYTDSRVVDQDIKPAQTVLVRLDLKYLGGTSFKSDATGSGTLTSAVGH
jgi:LPS-assembly protein